MMDDSIRKSLVDFVDQIIMEKGDELSDVEFEMERDRIVNLLEKKSEIAMVNALPSDKAAELERLMDEKGNDITEDEVIAIIQECRESIDDAVKKTIVEFREEYLKGEM